MRILKLIITFLLLWTGHIFAQHIKFITNGTIQFEKRINMRAFLKRNSNKYLEATVKKELEQYAQPQLQFRVLKSVLTFGNGKTLFTPLRTTNISSSYFDQYPTLGQPNTIYTDLIHKLSITEKTVFEKVFRLMDSTPKITWKFTSETRNIVGYTCRRANAIVLDSIYIVAFYADRIPVSGGPETFTGLPGMILQLSMPQENITWIATSVMDTPIAAGVIIPPTKGQPITNKELRTSIQSVSINWDEQKKQTYWKALLL